jgi:tetratricopeptide (TPR) repeat protein
MFAQVARPRFLFSFAAMFVLAVVSLLLWNRHLPLRESSAEIANRYLPDRAELQVKPGVNAEAYALYLRGRELEEHLNDQDLQGARDLYQQAILLDPKFALARARYSIVLSETARSPVEIEQARVLAEEALRLDPHLGPAHLARSLLFTKDGDENAAATEIDAALQASPKDAMVLYVAARLHRRQGKWKLALEEYKQSHTLNPRDFNSAIALAYTYAQLRDWPAAAQACDRSIAVAPQWYFNKICRAYLDLWWKGDAARANALLASVPPTYTGDFDNLLAWMRWDISLLQHNFNEADKALDAWRSDPMPSDDGPVPKIYLRGCIELVRDGRARAVSSFDAAREFFEKEVRAHPKVARSHAQLGTLYAFLGRKDDALREGLRAVELKPESEDAYEGPGIASMLAVIYAQTGETDKAIELVKRLLITPGALNFDTSITLNDLKLRWQWDPLRSDPRFQAIVNGPEPVTIIRSKRFQK